MQPVSAEYERIFSSPHRCETRLLINGTEYGEDKIISLSTSQSVYSSIPSVGNCIAGQIDVTLLTPSMEIPRMAELKPQARLVGQSGAVSEWIAKGTFYIDTRSTDPVKGTTTIHGYDAMLKAEQVFTDDGDQGKWPMKDIVAVEEICRRIGAPLNSDSRKSLQYGYDVQYPGYGDEAYTMREVLGYIGAMYGGNWIMSDTGEMTLIRLGDVPAETNYIVDSQGNPFVFGGDTRLLW